MSTYSEMLAKISALKKEAERTKKLESANVLKTIKRQIAEYGFTAKDLGFSSTSKSRVGIDGISRVKRSGKVSGGKVKVGRKVPPKFRDEHGNTWAGRGKQPKWVSNAVASGRSLESLRIIDQD